MHEANRAWLTERFKHALQLLACPPEIQFGKFPDFTHVPDELALESRTSNGGIEGNFRSGIDCETIVRVELIDECLSRMSKECYRQEAVSNSPEWQHIRRLAAEALNAFGWPLEDPPSYAHEFVRGS